MLTSGSAVLLLPCKTKSLRQESLCRSRLKSTGLSSPNDSKQNNGQLFGRNQTFPSLINGGSGSLSYRNRKMKNRTVIGCSLESGGQAPFPLNLLPVGSENWQLWALGTAIPLILSFTSGKWGPLLKFKEDADNFLEKAEDISDVVEEMAEKVEDMADKIGDQLPEGGKLRNTLELVEDLAEETAENAHRAGDLIDKVQEMEDKMEQFMESVEAKETNKSKDMKD